EVSVRNYWYTGLLDLIETLVSAAAEDDEEVLEVQAAHYFSDRRHDDIAHKRCHDSSERGADDHADCEIENVAAHREFFELFEHGVPPRMTLSVSMTLKISPALYKTDPALLGVERGRCRAAARVHISESCRRRAWPVAGS